MVVRIRLSRKGGKKKPFYRIVVAEAKMPRDGRFIDNIGIYDPTKEPSLIQINEEKAQDWIKKGAQPSNAVEKLLKISGLKKEEPKAKKKTRKKKTLKRGESDEGTSGTNSKSSGRHPRQS